MKLLLGIVAVMATVVNCLPRDDFLPFGGKTIDKKLTRRNKQSLSLSLREPFPFLGEEHSVLYILRDGYVSFSPQAKGSKIAPFNAKLKMTRGRSSVWYRTTVTPKEENEVVELIQQNFRSRGSFDVTSFSPSSFVIVTWENMAVRNREHQVIGNVTFQLILVADATHSFAFFQYDDMNEYPRPDHIGTLIDAGFTSGKDLHQWEFEMVYTTEAYKAATLFEAMRDSNVGSNGRWAYQIDGLMDGNISPAVAYVQPLEDFPQNDAPPEPLEARVDVQLDNAFDVEVVAFEDQCTRQTCSVNGRCVPYPTGHCCACNEDYIGNGIHCLPINENGRMNGRVNGTVNGVAIPSNVFLHTFIMAGGGRTFTAISPIPASIAYPMQVLLPIGELMGWMFASSASKGINGFMQTGGDLVYSAIISFESGEQVTVTQRFTGVDQEGGHIGGYTTIDGTIPNIRQGSSVTVEPHSEVYTKYRPGYVYSSEQRSVQVDSNQAVRFTVEQTITFQECEADDINTDTSLTAMRMNTSYAYSIFETEGEILRYAMITGVGPDAGVPTDSCQNNNCDVNAECLPQGTSFACQCRAGFTGDGYRCTEAPVDPCDNNNCSPYAYCYPSGDSFYCQCAEGYQGDGVTCSQEGEVDPCDANDCDRYAYCYPSSGGGFYCQCARGYTGDGRTCELEQQVDPCRDNRCDANAQCSPVEGAYTCSCNSGYRGDGYSCELQEGEVDPCDANDCDRYAYCYPSTGGGFYCQCARGYTGDGRTCELEQQVDPCRDNRCDTNAQCRPVEGGYTCSCNSGYRGDGYSCEPQDQLVPLCSDCSSDADCFPEGRGFRCLCRAGFNGNGMTCQDTNECVEGAEIACDPNAQCYNTRGSYTCSCRAGFRGDGFRCEALPEAQGSLVFGQGMSIMHQPLDGSRGNKVYMKTRQTAVGLSYDCREDKIYWTDVSGRAIMRASMDGREVDVVVNSSLSSPEGIAIDHLSRNIYWTDSGFDRIEVANLDGRNRHVLFDSDLNNPRAIAADPVGGYLYWADWDRSRPRIERSGMDGSERDVFVDSGLIMPNGLAIDLVSQLLCWADAGTQKLECMNLNGDSQTRYTVFTSALYPFGLASLGNNLYWTDWQTSNIQSINKNGGQEAQSLALPRGGNGKTYGVAAVTSCPDGNNRCNSQNGGCSNLCLPAPGVRATCTCPNALAANEIPCN